MISFVFYFTGILLTAYVGLLLYYRFGWKKIPVHGVVNADPDKKLPFISVIIAARNEEKNIVSLMDALKKQDYSKDFFEVIIVDDHSTDNTAAQVLQNKNKQITLMSAQADGSGSVAFKKMALKQGIAASKGELIVTTDADCTMSEKWLSVIASCYLKNRPKMIVMPVLISNSKNLLGIFQSIDFTTMQGITGAAVSGRFHGMCNGANLAYQKQAFMDVGGFQGIDKIASGDDMLLLEKIASHHKDDIVYLKSEDVIVRTAAAENVRSFIQQRLRWGGKTTQYKEKKLIAVLILVYLVNFFILLSFILGLLMPTKSFLSGFTFGLLEISGVFFLIKMLSELSLFIPVSGFFKNSRLAFWLPFLQPLHILYIVFVGALGRFFSYEWKGRKAR